MGRHIHKIFFLRLILVFLIAIILCEIIACGENDMTQQSQRKSQITDVSPVSWENIAAKRMFFGHQSVGRDILEGISILKKEHKDIKIRVEELKANIQLEPALWHLRIGKNTKPSTKISEFEKIVQDFGSQLDAAGLKFCYVDINQETDVRALFIEYQSSISRLESKFPHIKYIHFTVPLEATNWNLTSKVKSIIKMIIGKPDANYRRHEFNQLMRQAYANKEPVFDLARIESTFPDGKRLIRTKDGIPYETLVPVYTFDGGHLNELGRKIVAEHLLMFLINMTN